MKKLLQVSLVLMLAASMATSALAETKYRRVYDSRTHQYYYVPEKTLQQKARTAASNGIVKKTAIGAGVGAAYGLLSGREGVLKSAGVGALVGAGTGVIGNSKTLSDKPLIRRSLTGATVGTGVGYLTGNGAAKGAVVGGAAGAGTHFLMDYLNKDK